MIYTDFDYNKLINKEFNDIERMVNYLIKRNIKVNLVDFIKYINIKFYPEIDISFMEYSLKICMRKDEFCVNPIEEFVNLGVKKKKMESKDLVITMNRSGLIENEDFSELGHVPELRKQGGTSTKKSTFLSLNHLRSYY